MRLDFCVACGTRDKARLEHHHLIPKSEGGSNAESNLITLCDECHGRVHGRNRKNLREMCAEGKRKKRAMGGHASGSAPFGYDVVGVREKAMLVPNEAEQAVIAKARELRAANVSYRLTIHALTEAGHMTRAGTPFKPVQIARILERVPAD